jgi:hypothetical protein
MLKFHAMSSHSSCPLWTIPACITGLFLFIFLVSLFALLFLYLICCSWNNACIYTCWVKKEKTEENFQKTAANLHILPQDGSFVKYCYVAITFSSLTDSIWSDIYTRWQAGKQPVIFHHSSHRAYVLTTPPANYWSHRMCAPKSSELNI